MIDVGVNLREAKRTFHAQFESVVQKADMNLEQARAYIRIAYKLSPLEAKSENTLWEAMAEGDVGRKLDRLTAGQGGGHPKPA